MSVGITAGSDGNIWFTDQTDSAVWRYDLSSGIFTEFKLPTAFSFPGDITTGADGNMWFTEQAVGNSAASRLPERSPNSLAWIHRARSPRGRTATSGSPAPSRRGRTGHSGPRHHDLPDSEPGRPDPTGERNNLLFTEFSANKIGSITTDGVVTESPEIPGSSPTGITAGVRAQVWFLGTFSNRVYQTVVPR